MNVRKVYCSFLMNSVSWVEYQSSFLDSGVSRITVEEWAYPDQMIIYLQRWLESFLKLG